VKEKIKEIAPGLPTKVLKDGTVSRVTIVPFYDRTQLIHETIGTLETALSHEILISILVVIVLVLNLRASILISSLLPVAVLMTFVVMRYTGVDANVVALSGIAIAIGVMVDVGIVFVENIIRHLELPENKGKKGKALLELIHRSTTEVASAITTALATTVVSFLPVFFMENAEGKLFKPLAFTKTFALSASFILGLIVLPTLAYWIFSAGSSKEKSKKIGHISLALAGVVFAVYFGMWLPLALTIIGLKNLFQQKLPQKFGKYTTEITLGIVLMVTVFLLTEEWRPLGHGNNLLVNFLFTVILLGLILGALMTIVHFYEPILKWCLINKKKFLLIPGFFVTLGIIIWLGFATTFGWISWGFDKIGVNIRTSAVWSGLSNTFPGVGKEFMPPLNEGSFLLMPTSMPHAGIEQNKDVLQTLDRALANIPEVDMAVGKLGRTESALDPAPISMYETIVNYKPEYMVDEDGHRLTFKTDSDGKFVLTSGETVTQAEALTKGISQKDLIRAANGDYFRNWRPQIKNPDDIWEEIVRVTKLPGVTSAPKLQPIQTRLIMLQTGMRAPMGIKVYGPDLKTIENFGMELESILKSVPSVKPESVFADRIVGKPYLELDIDRTKIARYGLSVEQLQQAIEIAVGGMPVTTTVEGRERFPVRVRYPRELRDNPESIKSILIPTPTGVQIPLGDLVKVEYVRGPQMIKSEETFLVGYVLFDKKEDRAEVDVVEEAQRFINQKIESGELKVPAGISYKFSGSYENQIRATKRLAIVIPISLVLIFLLLYFQFKTVTASAIHFSGVFVAFAGGFLMIWLYGQGWFMNFDIAGINMRDLFQMHTINLSVAVWVGFIALFGIATDDGVIMGTYIHQVFEERNPQTVPEVRAAVLEAGKKRVRPAMMTAAVAIIALLPVLTSSGKGSDIMIPMAIPTFGGMLLQVMTMFVVPVFQAIWRERVVSINDIKNE
jgi:Cu(I)/Ag(I) efflux system membrane protein CusA/SilA